ncbi:MAG: hypothetical protein F6J97_22410 [Leptolyngbya sp. SIO4C1]|nr:hypothetical protein [Leptolyngbya sp. SIO4C1]
MSETQLRQRIIQKLEGMGQETLAFLDRFIDSLYLYRRAQQLAEPETPAEDEQRRAFISSLRGKYAHVATSSDEFAHRKQAEIDWEDRNL